MKKIITTIGSAVEDILFYTDDCKVYPTPKDLRREKLIGFEYGAKIVSDQVYFTFGGGGVNTAMTFGRFGLQPDCMISLGHDESADKIKENMRANNIGTGLIQYSSKFGTGRSFIINVLAKNEHVSFVYKGASDDLSLSQTAIAKIRTHWIYLTALSGNWRQGLKALFAHAKKHNIHIAWNPGSHQIESGLSKLSKFLKGTHTLLVNKDEATELLLNAGRRLKKRDCQSLIKEIHQGGQAISVITDGRRGAHVYDGKKLYFHKSLAKNIVNTNGAGDAFGSGFIVGIIRLGDIQRAMHLGMLNSAGVISKIGSQTGLLTSSVLKRMAH